MTRDLLVLGAGYTGARLAALAAREGWNVVTTNTTKRPETVDGVRSVVWRIGDSPKILTKTLGQTFSAVYSVPPVEGVDEGAVLRALRGIGATRFVYLSSASIYGDHDGDWVNEESPCNPTSPAGAARKRAEETLFAEGGDVYSVRIVGIYGPGRTLAEYVRGGRYKLVDGGEKVTNRIHVDDLVSTILAVLERAPAGPRTYLAADGHPVSVRELVDWMTEHLGIAPPEQESLAAYEARRGKTAADRWRNTYRADNSRIRDELGVELEYPNVFAGYRAIFGVDS